jgi:hypothetical protein
MQDFLQLSGPCKWSVGVQVIYSKFKSLYDVASSSSSQSTDFYTKTFMPKLKTLYPGGDLEGQVNSLLEELVHAFIEKEVEGGSDFIIYSINRGEIVAVKFSPISAGSNTFIAAPNPLKKSTMYLSANDDLSCFVRSISLLTNAMTSPPVVDFTGCSDPMTQEGLSIFTKRNPLLSLRVIFMSPKKNSGISNFHPCAAWNKIKNFDFNIIFHARRAHGVALNLLWMAPNDHVEGHFLPISNLRCFINQVKYETKRATEICERCLCMISYSNTKPSVADLSRKHHQRVCINTVSDSSNKLENDKSWLSFPTSPDRKKSPRLAFDQHRAKLEAPVFIVADFECILDKRRIYDGEELFDIFAEGDVVEDDDDDDDVDHEDSGPKTKRARVVCEALKNRLSSLEANHLPVSFSLVLIASSDSTIIHEETYCGRDAGVKFLHTLEIVEKIAGEYVQSLDKHPLPVLSAAEEASFLSAVKCHVCGNCFSKSDEKVRDHCHASGKYRGAAHSNCNLNFHDKKRAVPCLFHNFAGYDAHLILSSLDQYVQQCTTTPKLQLMARTSEKMISIRVNNIRISDSFFYFPNSLGKLCETLSKEDFRVSREGFSHLPDELLTRFISRKGVFPYDYLTFDNLSDTKLPSREMFFNKLNNTECSVDDYNHALEMFKLFRCNTLKDYVLLYNRLDVYQLADVLSTFRRSLLAQYGLDLFFYITLPAFGKAIMLKEMSVCDDMICRTGIALFPLEQSHFHRYFELAIRGGLSLVSRRIVTANIPSSTSFDKTLPPCHISYLDINSLYAWAMQQPLPFDSFRWVEEESTEWENVVSRVNESSSSTHTSTTGGYYLEVDLSYPRELHDMHNDFPLAPHKMTVESAQLSPHLLTLAPDYNPSRVDKLVTTFLPRKNYRVHFLTLQFYIKHGMKIDKVHSIIAFREKPFILPYVTKTSSARRNAKNNVDNLMAKLLANSVFGKMLENKRNRRSMELVTDERRFNKIARNPLFSAITVLGEFSCIMERDYKTVMMDSPIQVGAAILDLAKLRIFRFVFEVLKPWDPTAKICYSDTDSIIFSSQKPLSDFIVSNPSEFDCSNYPLDNPLYNVDNKCKLGVMKDELAKETFPATEFIGLCAKSYSISSDSPNEANLHRAKGVPSFPRGPQLRHAHYRDVLYTSIPYEAEFLQFTSFKQHIATMKTRKTALTALDDKRYLCDDYVTSYSYGHWRIEEEQLLTE